jgi:MoaA/NifB/PqqE/SkfB family radical SAM enzyme
MKLDERKADYLFHSKVAQERLNNFLQDGDCYPLHIVVHPTMICNHRCHFCNYFHNLDLYGQEDSRLKSISVNEFSKILQGGKELEISNLVISGGGDPLAHKEIKAILHNTLPFPFSKHIYTNLDFNIEDEVVELLSKLDSLNVNINTFDPNLYRQLRGKHADLSRVIRNLQLLRESGAYLRSVLVVKDDNINSVQKTIDSLLNFGVTKIVISPAFDLPYADGIGISESSIKKLIDIKNKYYGFDIKFIRQVEEAVFEKSGNSYCRTHHFDVTIGADSFVYPCCLTAYREEYRLLDLKRFNSFKEAWNSPERKSKIKNLDFKCSICWFGKANEYLQTIGVT